MIHEPTDLPTPCYLVDEASILRNLRILDSVQQRTGCRILLALKGFAMFPLFPLIRQYLRGVAASSVHEARLGFEEFGGEVHACSPAFKESEFRELLEYCSHVVLNSFAQWSSFRPVLQSSPGKVRTGIRVNPNTPK